LLDQVKVDVLEDRAGLVLGEPTMILLHDQAPIPERAVGKRRRCLADQYDIYRAAEGALQANDQLAEIQCADTLVGFETDSDVDVAARMCNPTCVRPKDKGVGDSGFIAQYRVKSVHRQ
jgi:hypothetical protein